MHNCEKKPDNKTYEKNQYEISELRKKIYRTSIFKDESLKRMKEFDQNYVTQKIAKVEFDLKYLDKLYASGERHFVHKEEKRSEIIEINFERKTVRSIYHYENNNSLEQTFFCQ